MRDWVSHCWSVRWQWPDGLKQTQATLPHPQAHLVFEADGRASVHGVQRSRFERTLQGEGWVLGLKLKPGALRPWIREPASAWTDQVRPLAAIFGDAAQSLAQEVLALHEPQQQALRVQHFLLERLPAHDEQALLASELVAQIEQQRDWLRAEQLAAHSGLSLRSLQRLFDDYVGVSPKWVIQRYRLHEAIEQLQIEAGAPSLAELAQRLGYFDQAHFNRDFRALVGMTPGAYLRLPR